MKNMIFMALQLFADDPAPSDPKPGNLTDPKPADPKPGDPAPDSKPGEPQKKYTDEDVDKIINSALLYELGVLKTYAEPLLFSVKENDPVYPEALRLINFLRNFLPIPSEEVPKDSVLREFIGNSCFGGNNLLS